MKKIPSFPPALRARLLPLVVFVGLLLWSVAALPFVSLRETSGRLAFVACALLSAQMLLEDPANKLLSFARMKLLSVALPLTVLIVLFLWSLAGAILAPLRELYGVLAFVAAALLAAQMIMRARAGSGPTPEPTGEPTPEAGGSPGGSSSAQQEAGGGTSSPSLYLGLREAREGAIKKIGDLALKLQEDRAQHQTVGELDSTALADVNAVRRIAEELAALAETAGESASSVRSLREMAARLQAATLASGEEPEGAGGQLQELELPETWLGKSNAPAGDYFLYLAAQVQRAQELLDAHKGMVRTPQPIDWRTDAEALLLLAGRRISTPGGLDSALYQRLHNELLALLGYQEIRVSVGDPINREEHRIESSRATDKIRPNKVLEILSPGYVDTRSSRVWRQATVIMSEQILR